ncbi:MAG TPA: hypothetical protein PK526_02010 [bacterium]|nr:hypothetical protein [bacterium]
MSENKDLMLDVSQAEELKLAFRRHGYTNKDIKTLSEKGILGEVLKVIKGQAEIRMIEHLIDCDAAPFIPDGWSVENHKPGGLFKFDPAKISLYLSKKQKKGDYSVGTELRKELGKMSVLNANVLDCLLANPVLIPEEWKGKAIFFWGTIYRSSGGSLCVRCLNWSGSNWNWNYSFLGDSFNSDSPAALAS